MFKNYAAPGLDPRNQIIANMYRLAAEDYRAGDGAYLFSTISVQSALSILDEFDHHLPTWLDRQQAFDLLMDLGRIELKYRGEAENRERDRKIKEIEQRAANARGRR